MDQKKTAYLGLFAAIAIIFGYVESLIPFFAGIPGMKLGLANLAVLFVLERYTWKEAALVSIVRIFIIGFMFGSGSSIMYSLAGATLSLIVMVFVKNKIGFGQLGQLFGVTMDALVSSDSPAGAGLQEPERPTARKGIIQALEEKLGAKLYICDEAQLCGALGAALFAYEKCNAAL